MAGNPVQVTPLQIIDARTGLGIAGAGCLLYTYAAGTNTPLATYTDSTLGTPNTNPVQFNSGGYAVNGSTITGVWVGSASYKLVLKDSGGNTMTTQDNVQDQSQSLKALLALSSGSSLVGYIQAGTNPVAQTVQSRLRQFVLVTDYTGVDPTGVADSSTGIQNAINDCIAKESILYFPYGVYNIGTAGLTFGSKITVIARNGCRLNYSGTGYAMTVGTANAGDTNYRFAFNGLRVVMSDVAGSGWLLCSVSFSTFTDCSAEAANAGPTITGNGIVINSYAAQSIINTYINCKFSLLKKGVTFLSTGVPAGNRVTTQVFEGCIINGPGAGPLANSVGVSYEDANGDGCDFISCNIEYMAQGLFLGETADGGTGNGYGAKNGHIDGCRFEGNTVDLYVSQWAYCFRFTANNNMTVITLVAGGNLNTHVFIGNMNTSTPTAATQLMQGNTRLNGAFLNYSYNNDVTIRGIKPLAGTGDLLQLDQDNGQTGFHVSSGGFPNTIQGKTVNINAYSGDPEGIVTAPAGSLCLAETGELYIKNSGAGNVGWKIVTHA